jgi:hypothetical protein
MKILSKKLRRTLLLGSVLAGGLSLDFVFTSKLAAQNAIDMHPCIYISRHGTGSDAGACLGTGGTCNAWICP